MKLKQFLGLYSKHALHVTALFSFIALLEYTSICVLLALPQIVSNLIGLTIYNAFPGEVKIDESLLKNIEGSGVGGGNTNTSISAGGDNNSDHGEETNNITDNSITSGDNNKLSQLGGDGGETPKAIANGVANGIVIDMPNGNSSPTSTITSNNHHLDANGNVPPKPILPAQLPHLCFRVVTRGLYPALVQRNVNKNYLTCVESGLDNFSIEVVTDKKIYLSNTNFRVRQLVVPANYRSSTGAMFKARALQYALEPKSSLVRQGDYIVHLDEETLVTRNVIYGICNFTLSGKHAFGQGLITYTSQDIVNWITTLADSYRVADDMGKMRFQLRCLHKPVFGWKGSFVVTKYEAEKDVSFDHGPDGSIAEDCYFSMEAHKKGYTFDFIDGEMWEKSPFTILDLIRQRKRWIQGIWLVVHSGKIPISKKFLLAMSHYAMLTLPITSSSFVLTSIFPLPTPMWMTILGTFCFATTLYMYFFGVIKSFDLRQTNGLMLLVYLFSQVIVLPINIVCENIATIWGLLGPKHNFYIVGKEQTETKIRNCR